MRLPGQRMASSTRPVLQGFAHRPRGAKSVAGLLIFVCFFLDNLTAQVKPIRRVLVLNEVGTAYPLINLVDQGIRTSLADSPYRVEFYREYMETVLFPDPVNQHLFRSFYLHK